MNKKIVGVILCLVVLGIVVVFLNSDKGNEGTTVSQNQTQQSQGTTAVPAQTEQMIQKETAEVMDSKTEAAKESDSMVPKTTSQASYEPYSETLLSRASQGKVVLFFRASWCPTCRSLDSNIKANIQSVKENVTILDVNYDTYSDLKKKYGVTYQHTLVQVDAQGNLIQKWGGSPNLSDILSRIQ